ncbi:unnamed protein product [Rotaria sp. Silwood2]|nr:unnamed protein product [Rotaria sp. Silwood2]
MSCPIIRPVFDNVRNDDNESSMIDGLSISTTTENGTNNYHKTVDEPLNYTKYLKTDILLSALKCLSHTDRSDDTSPPVHDEHFFILIHQVFELWFKQILFEIDSIRYIFSNNDNVAPFLFDINLRLNRTANIWNMLIDQLHLLESMTPMEFLEFRDFITPASGFQSFQFRLIEMKLGLTDQHRSAYKANHFTQTMFKDKQAHALQTAVKEDTLLRLIERWLEKIYDNTSFNFNNIFASAIQRMIDHEKQESILNGTDEKTAERKATAITQQFETIINENEYSKLLKNGERRISQKAMLSALMISLYYQEPYFQQAYKMLSLLIDIDGLMASWRCIDKYQVFIDLSNVSSYLIPERFLPKFIENSTESATSISSITFQSCSEVPIIHKQQSYKPRYQSNQDLVQYYQIPFFMLLFFTGCIFATLISRLS